jgi:hypothetical protein
MILSVVVDIIEQEQSVPVKEIVHAFIPQLHEGVGFHKGVPEAEVLEVDLI